MKNITGNRKIIDVLNCLGHCIDYHMAEEIETELVTSVTEKIK